MFSNACLEAQWRWIRARWVADDSLCELTIETQHTPCGKSLGAACIQAMARPLGIRTVSEGLCGLLGCWRPVAGQGCSARLPADIGANRQRAALRPRHDSAGAMLHWKAQCCDKTWAWLRHYRISTNASNHLRLPTRDCAVVCTSLGAKGSHRGNSCSHDATMVMVTVTVTAMTTTARKCMHPPSCHADNSSIPCSRSH